MMGSFCSICEIYVLNLCIIDYIFENMSRRIIYTKRAGKYSIERESEIYFVFIALGLHVCIRLDDIFSHSQTYIVTNFYGPL